jgi:hypothetical protein
MTEHKGGMADDWFQTYSGVLFTLPEFDPANINITDIAHGLSLQCRFNGHIREFYSVAQHSLLVQSIVSPENRMWALMHDAAEAYLGDIVGPLKRLLPDYRKFEKELMGLICDTFWLPRAMPAEVKAADMILLATEKRDLVIASAPKPWESLAGIEPMAAHIDAWPPVIAEAKFLERFEELKCESNKPLVPACEALPRAYEVAMITVAGITRIWLLQNGYSGLITEGCGCPLSDLFPCDREGVEMCEPGYAGKSGYVYGTRELAEKDDGPPEGEEQCP